MESEEVIREQLNDILNHVAETQNITNFETNPNIQANYGDGFAAQFYTGNILNKDTGDTTFVAIKKAPNFDPEFDINSIFRNEHLFYSTLLPALEDLQKEMGVLNPFNNYPKYFCGGINLKKEYIAMENLKPLGYVMFDKTQYLGKDNLEKIFKIYGKFHALSYVLRIKDKEKYQNIGNEFKSLFEKMAEFNDKQLSSAVSAAVKSLDSESDKIVYEELKDFGENAIETFLKSFIYNGEHRCLVHGDCWSNNMLFKYSESGELLDIKLIDFQLCEDNSPIHDLSYFFYSGGSKQDFDDLDNYLEIYHKSFTNFAKELDTDLQEIFSFQTLQKEWKENAIFGVLMGIFVWQVKLTPKEKLKDALIPNPDKKTTMQETMKRWETVMSTLHDTDEFKKKTTAILRHAFEYGVVNKNKIVRKSK